MERVQRPPSSLVDYEQRAEALLDPALFAWLQGGSLSETSLRANAQAFDQIGLYNRVLADLRDGSTRLDLLGRELAHPILLAPLAQHARVHAEGEIATASGAAGADALMVSSCLSSRTLEDIASASPRPGWLQLYWQPRRNDTLDLLRRAETAGYGAIVLSLDAPVQPPSWREIKAANGGSLPMHAANLSGFAPMPTVELERGSSRIFQGMMAEAPRWQDLEWLREQTALPLLAKGISHPDDAARLIDCGVQGVIVSNHGGRALDGVPAPVELLPAIRARLGKQTPVLVDGGIRRGSDVFKSIALGADAVLVGRPQLHALAVAGASGVAHMLRILRDELELCMALAGCARIADIDRHALTGGAFFLTEPLSDAYTC